MSHILVRPTRSLAAPLASIVLLAAGCDSAPPDAAEDLAQPVVSGPAPVAGAYAPEVYREFAEASGGRVAFDVSAVSTGALVDVAGRPANETLAPPAYWIRHESVGTAVTTVIKEAR